MRLIGRKTIAAFFGVSTRTVSDWMKMGMPYSELLKDRLLFVVVDSDEATAWKNSGVRLSRPRPDKLVKKKKKGVQKL